MIELRRGPLTAALGVWVGVHLLLACLTLRESTAPAATLVAALLGVGTAAAVLVPLGRGRPPVGAPLAAAAALAVPVVALVDGLLVVPSALDSYALWWPGMVAPVVGGLAVRGRTGHATAAAALALAALAGVLAVRWPRPGWAATVLVLSTPVVLWWAGGLVVGRLARRSVLSLQRSEDASSAARDRRARTLEHAARRAEREALVARTAVPLLRRIADDDDPLDAGLRERAAAVELALRTELRGRDLLDQHVRRAAGDARARGIAVDVVDHAPGDAPDDTAVPGGLRRLVTAALDACADGSLTARRPPGGPLLTLVHVGSPGSRSAVASAVRAVGGALVGRGLRLVVSEDGESLVAEVTPAGGQPAGRGG